MHKALIERGLVAFVALAMVASGVRVPTAQAGPGSGTVNVQTAETVRDAPARMGPAYDDCAWYEFFCLNPQGTADPSASNADVYLYSAETPCNGEALSFWPGASDKLFRWSEKQPVPWTGVAPSGVRVKLWPQSSPGGTWSTPFMDPAERKASFDLMELQSTGQQTWWWHLVDITGDSKISTWSDGENEHDVRVSSPCKFTLDYHEPPAAAQPVDQGTGAFPSAGDPLKASDPCGQTVVIKDNDTQRVFHFSTNYPSGVFMNFAKKSDGIWKQYAAPGGAITSGEATIDLKQLVDAGSYEWKWRVYDSTPNGKVPSNDCDLTIAVQQSSPDTASGAPGFKEQASYSGDCAKRPSGTICLSFPDGYVWLISDSVVRWEDRGSVDGKQLRVAVGEKAEYQHLLGTTLVRQVPL